MAFDTETSGLEDFKRDPDDPAQPHLLQLGAVMVDSQWREIQSFRMLVRPEGWVVAKEAVEVHGITTDMAHRYGLPAKVVLASFNSFLAVSRWAIAHNLEFDKRVIEREMRKLQAKDKGLSRGGLRKVCTMHTGAAAMPDGKFPSLALLYEILTDYEYREAHDGLADARAAMTCCRLLVEKRLIDP